MMIFSLVAMIGLDKCCITSACLQWLCHSGERIMARGPLVNIWHRDIITIKGMSFESNDPASILHKSIAGRYRPVSYPDGPITARYRIM